VIYHSATKLEHDLFTTALHLHMSASKTKTKSEASTDRTLIEQANHEFAHERLLAAARLLRQVVDATRFTSHHIWILKKAERIERVAVDLMVAPGPEWKKQGESHGTYDTMIYYKVSTDGNAKMTARLETPIEQSLLIPLLAVFNETKLYTTWMPHWERPIRSGVRKTQVLRQEGRCNQLLMVTTDSPWPFSSREVLIDVVVSDDIDANGAIVVKMDSALEEEEAANVPPPEGGAVRCIFDGGLLFRKCPKDHASFYQSKHHQQQVHCDDDDEGGDDGGDSENGAGDKSRDGDTPSDDTNMILVCCEFMVDPLLTNVPQIIINFVTRTALGGIWAELLQMAQDVRDNKQPLLAAAIQEKREHVYDFIEERIDVMLSQMTMTTDEDEDDAAVNTASSPTSEKKKKMNVSSGVKELTIGVGGVDKAELGEVLGFL
jgi:hypothetical protein